MKNKSFTLIELLVVIVIIGILAGVIIISTTSSINKAAIAKIKVSESNIQNELGANMVSRWKLDEINGVTTPEAWGNNTGTLGDGATSTTYPTLKPEAECVSEQCMYFDGGDRVSIPDKPEFNFGNEMSAFIWIKGNNTTGYQSFLSQWSDGTPAERSWMLYHSPTSSNKLIVYLSTDGSYTKMYQTTENIFDNNWHLIGFTFNNGTLKLYLDGREAEVVKIIDNTMNILFNANFNINIGCYFNNNNVSSPFKGFLDDARLYNAALSSAQTKQQYVAGLNSLLSKNLISPEEYNIKINSLASN